MFHANPKTFISKIEGFFFIIFHPRSMFSSTKLVCKSAKAMFFIVLIISIKVSEAARTLPDQKPMAFSGVTDAPSLRAPPGPSPCSYIGKPHGGSCPSPP